MPQKFIRFPFATSGDRTAIPDGTDVSGNVSYEQGYGPDYQRPKTDPLSKDIERDKMNALFHDLTENQRQYQLNGAPDWVPASENGGVAVQYSAGSRVRYTDGLIYISAVASNTSTPGANTDWVRDVGRLVRTTIYQRSGITQQVSVNGSAFTSTGASTFTPLPGVSLTIVQVVGGGGAGGSSGGTGGGSVAGGGGGGGGGSAYGIFQTSPGTVAVTVGAAGASGAAGIVPGGNGGTSSFGTTMSASGGSGGAGGIPAPPPGLIVGGAGGTSSGVGVLIRSAGGFGGSSHALSLDNAVSGFGGSSVMGGGAAPRGAASPGNGLAAASWGGGGGGALTLPSSAGGNSGGAGAPGCVIVEEYV